MPHASLLLRKNSLYNILVPNCLCSSNIFWKYLEELFALILFNHLASCFVTKAQRTWLESWKSWPSEILKQTQNYRIKVQNLYLVQRTFLMQKQMLRKIRLCKNWSARCLQSQDSRIWGKRHILALEYVLVV